MPNVAAGLSGLIVYLLAAAPAAAMDDPALPYPMTVFPDGATSAEVTLGDLTAGVTMERRPAIDPEADVPVLRVVKGGTEVLEFTGISSGFGYPSGQAGIAEIDSANRGPEVYFTAYSGGAHCCTQVVIATETPAGWKAVEVGTFDGGPDYLEDANFDGFMEVVTVDNRFLYAFDCYACSAAPLVIRTVRGGEALDVSEDPSFQDRHREWLRTLVENEDAANLWTDPGFIAGWVAAKARIGEGAAAFREFTGRWNLAADEGEEWCTVDVDFDACPADRKKVLKFPDRLRQFLGWTGYPI